ncbi:phosphotransferase [Georgenia sp. SYP-B2076]|uniref:phosphotransferase n=1 Tax=Georgenia sp. SYP-B2076 TaxID=2495881 RepID=UPI000F8E9FE8|nr:phosphotransferase [Georgenia sp. SYP-B2076]
MTGPAATAPSPGVRRQYVRFLDAIDPDVMRPLLLAALGGDAEEGCEVLDAKYEPGKPAAVLYRLGSRLVRGTVAPDGDAPGVPVAEGIGATCFPDDPGLATLPAVVDPRTFVPALDAALPDTVAEARMELLRYRPGRRVTFLVTAAVRHGGTTTPTRFVAKVYHDPAKAAAVAAEGRALLQAPADPDLTLAPVLAHLPELAVVVQGYLPGHPLDVAVSPASADPGLTTGVARAGRALAALHRRSVPAPRPRLVDNELRRFVARAGAVRSVDAAAGDTLLGLARRLLGWRRPDGTLSVVHGDCKPDQFLLQADHVALLDLDHCGLADPASDVGTFVASLRQEALRTDHSALATAARLGTSFVDGYTGAAAPAGVTATARPAGGLPARAEFYVAVALMRKALRAHARAPLSPLTRDYVEDAHWVLDHLDGRQR